MTEIYCYRPKNGCFLRFCDLGYIQPNSEDVRWLLKEAQLTSSTAAQIVGVTQRTMRKWTANQDSPSFSQIPYAAWRLLLIELNMLKELENDN